MLSAAGRRAAAGVLRPQQPLLGHALGLNQARVLVLSSTSPSSLSKRTLSSAPQPGDAPFMERRADRELPDVAKETFRWSRTMPWFLLIVAASSVAIFNYQKSSSPVVASTLYALRTSPKARAYLGDEIYFQQRIPWIGGEMNQLQGRINVHFMVKGTRNAARMRFTSRRPTARGVFETLEWTLETADGHKIDLLEDVTGDPFRGINVLPDDLIEEMEADYGILPPAASRGVLPSDEGTRGFRQPTRK